MTDSRPPRSTPRHEYLARIHRVQDYIESRLAEDLSLDELARIACFSPFHFHRVFTAVTGEPVYRFVSRLRVERAARQLRFMPAKSITEIALDCGFAGPSQFARAFRAEMGMSASEFRELPSCDAPDSKIRKAFRKVRREDGGAHSYGPSIGEPPDDPGNSTQDRESPMTCAVSIEPKKIIVEKREPIPVAYVRHVGPYAGNPELFARLFGTLMKWAGPRGLASETEWPPLLTICHDNPSLTAPDKYRISAGLMVPHGTRTEDPVALLELAAGTYASATFELVAADYPAAWGWVYGQWLPSSGYVPDDGPAYERYLSDCGNNRRHLVEINVPVRPL